MDDDDADVRAFLAGTDTPPSRVDLRTVVADGQRRVRRRWVVAVAGSSAVVLAGLVGVPAAIATVRGAPVRGPAVGAGPSVSDSPPDTAASSKATLAPPDQATAPGTASPAAGACAAHPLALPPGVQHAKALSVDPTGRYVGGEEDGKTSRGILWTDGQPTILPIHEDAVEVDAVNEHGVAAGIAMDNAGKVEYVFRYAGGKVTKLSNVAGYTHVFPAPAINAAGDIVVNAETSSSIEGADSIAMIWKAGTTLAERIPLKTADNVMAITDGGTLIGAHYTNSEAAGAAAWTETGQEQRLDQPAGTVGAAYAARGTWATGGLWNEGTARSLAGTPLWNVKTGAVTVLPGGVANAVNSSGVVVSDNSELLRAGRPAQPLPQPPAGRNFAAALSDTNLVVGSVNNDTTSTPMTWAC
jgi:hypothetical protein